MYDNLFIFNGKSSILEKFYLKYPHFNHLKFIKDNNLKIHTEDECINYILNNANVDIIESAYIQPFTFDKYVNIYIGKCVKQEYYYLTNEINFSMINIKPTQLDSYNDNITYLIIDSIHLNNEINIKYINKIILYINSVIEENMFYLIKKYNIQYYIINNNINLKTELLNTIEEYKLILDSDNFDDCFNKIYNYKKKYISIPENKIINFEEFYDFELLIYVKSMNNVLNIVCNNVLYNQNVIPGILNKIFIKIKNTNIIDIKFNEPNILYKTFHYRKENEPIRQLYLTSNLYGYKQDNRIHVSHNLCDYNDIDKPAFFYGMVRLEDIQTIINHKGKKYIIFSGGDIDVIYHINKNTNCTKNRLSYIKQLQELDEIYYIPRSSFMINDMKLLNYKYTYIPFFADTFSCYIPKPKGNNIYYYTYPDYQKYLYGDLIVDEIKKRLPQYTILKLTHPKAYFANKEYC